jgi:putative sigma-54 modulation protein
MNVFVHHNREPVTPDLQQLIERHMATALDRIDCRLGRIDVYVTDVNGPRGGVDQVVRVVVQLGRLGPVFVQAQHHELPVAVANAAQKARRAVRRVLRRKRTMPIRHHQRTAKTVAAQRRAAAAAGALAAI